MRKSLSSFIFLLSQNFPVQVYMVVDANVVVGIIFFIMIVLIAVMLIGWANARKDLVWCKKQMQWVPLAQCPCARQSVESDLVWCKKQGQWVPTSQCPCTDLVWCKKKERWVPQQECPCRVNYIST